MDTLKRTYDPKYTTYQGDGTGRDGYIVFANGGLNDVRNYTGSKPNNWQSSYHSMFKGVTPKKDATAFDYKPDGTGRDTYVINAFGLKNDYKSDYLGFQRGLRSEHETPMMDLKTRGRTNQTAIDITMYNNWPSAQQRRRNQILAHSQRQSVERLSGSPKNNTQMTFSTPKVAHIESKITSNQNQFLTTATLKPKLETIQVNPNFRQKSIFAAYFPSPTGPSTAEMLITRKQTSVYVTRKPEAKLSSILQKNQTTLKAASKINPDSLFANSRLDTNMTTLEVGHSRNKRLPQPVQESRISLVHTSYDKRDELSKLFSPKGTQEQKFATATGFGKFKTNNKTSIRPQLARLTF